MHCAVLQEEKSAMKKLGPKLEVSPATKRLWQELKQEMVSLTLCCKILRRALLWCGVRQCHQADNTMVFVGP